MVFSSIPAYLDPANWQQQPNHHHQVGTSNANHQLPIIPPQTVAAAPPSPSSQPPYHHVGVGSVSSRAGSMSERARLANIPMPEGPLKCPRCESTNTKFCYFNNYSLSQPRHFCKTCRRYWTRGGALRSVPVGGGCRRNKRSKSRTSTSSISAVNKSPVSGGGGDLQTTSTSTGSLSRQMNGQAAASADNNSSMLLGGLNSSHQLPPLHFMSPFAGQLSDDHHYTTCGDHIIGLNFGGISTPLVGRSSSEMMNFHIGTNNLLGGFSSGGGSGGIEQWRLEQAHNQFPFLSGLDSSAAAAGLYDQFQGGGGGGGGFMGGEASSHQVRAKQSATSMLSQPASVKMEDSNNHPAVAAEAGAADMNLTRQYLLGMSNGASNTKEQLQQDKQWNNR